MYIYRLIPKTIRSRLLKIFNLSNILSSASKREILSCLITNKPIIRNGYYLSNYGVWLYKNNNDKSFDFALRGYRNGLDRILNSIHENFDYVDIGANQGIFALLAAKSRHCQQIYCFEPNLKVAQKLQLNLDFNNVTNYEIHKVAISKKDELINFFVPKSHSGAGKIATNLGVSNQVIRSISRYKLNVIFEKSKPVLFVKIDVQGFELEVLVELLNSNFKNKIKYLFLEVVIGDGNFEKITQVLYDNRFIEVKRFGSKTYFDIFYKKL